MSQSPQNYENHGKYVPGYHYVLTGLGLACLVGAVIQMFREPSLASLNVLLLVIALVFTAAYTRLFPLKAQDRVIRLEMQLRLVQILPEDLRSRIEELRSSQLVALRFASDEELPQLVRDVLDGKLTTSKEIKQKITNWKADHLRV